jgi:hypothetical protein
VGADAAEAGGASSSYYAVASVDSFGDESAQSLGISPATIAAAAGGGAAGGGGGCFVDTLSAPIPKQGLWWLALLMIAGAISCRRQA